ncbi:hypothetical protein K458DRAFT_483522 [Lentithecium fluviatile CBS 122367]|uniref:Mid2 domain-containing protein n=1 Tax=Lentithecium fluviatile CBS 122367 TaxID=1168545 RepID=A0A6G1JIN3_9PLEO|nr:hypothetical protein K458DRAFT_483522 [Lentithecium fluviatile CBS 122367]
MMAFLNPLAVLLELSLVALVSCTPVHPRDPTITAPAILKRETQPSNFIGYYFTYSNDSDIGTMLSSYHTGGTDMYMSVSGTLVNYCFIDGEDSDCASNFWTTCLGSTIYSSAGSSVCADRCDYDIIYTGSITSTSDNLKYYRCRTSSWHYFYQLNPHSDAYFDDWFASVSKYSEALSMGSTTGDTLTSLLVPSPSQPASSIASETPTPTPTGTSTGTPSGTTETPIPAPIKKSQTWIAGAVIGPVGFLAFAGLSFYLIRRRRNSKEQDYQAAPQMSPFSPQILNPDGSIAPLPPPAAGYYDGKDSRISQSTGPTTYSMYSQTASGPTQAYGGSMQDLPEFVQPPRNRA